MVKPKKVKKQKKKPKKTKKKQKATRKKIKGQPKINKNGESNIYELFAKQLEDAVYEPNERK